VDKVDRNAAGLRSWASQTVRDRSAAKCYTVQRFLPMRKSKPALTIFVVSYALQSFLTKLY